MVLTNEQTIRILSSFARLELVFPGVQRSLKARVCEGFPKIVNGQRSAENAQQVNEILGNLCLLDIYEEELVEVLKDIWFSEPAFFLVCNRLFLDVCGILERLVEKTLLS